MTPETYIVSRSQWWTVESRILSSMHFQKGPGSGCHSQGFAHMLSLGYQTQPLFLQSGQSRTSCFCLAQKVLLDAFPPLCNPTTILTQKGQVPPVCLMGELSTSLGLPSERCAYVTLLTLDVGQVAGPFRFTSFSISNYKLNYWRVWLYINIILHSMHFKIFVCRRLCYIDVFNEFFFKSYVSYSPNLPLNLRGTYCVLAIAKT